MTSENEWGAIRLKSKAGVWYLAKTPAIKKSLEETPPGKTRRAVFTRGELNAALPSLKGMSQHDRDRWLAKMIEIKQNFENVRIENVKTHTGSVILNPGKIHD